MVSPATASLISGVTGLALVALNSTPALWLISNRLVRRKYGELSALVHLYEDRDGVATEETEKKFSDKVQKVVIAAFSVAGFFVSVALSVSATLKPDLSPVLDQWIQAGVWVCLLLEV